MFDNVRKGITPVIAIVLLLMMTVGAVGGAYAWFNQIMQDAQDQATSELETEMNVFGIECYSPSAGEGRVKVFLENTGESAVDFSPVDMIVYDGPTGERTVGLSTRGLQMSANRRGSDGGVEEVADAADLQDDANEPGDLAGYVLHAGGEFEDNRNYDIEFRFTNSDYQISGTCTAESRY